MRDSLVNLEGIHSQGNFSPLKNPNARLQKLCFFPLMYHSYVYFKEKKALLPNSR